MQVRSKRLAGFCRTHSDGDADAALAQPRHATAADLRVGVLEGDHDAGDSRFDERIRARRGAAMMRAWLQGDVGGPASGRVPGGRQGFGLRVGLAGSSVEPLADDVSVAHDDAPDPRVRCSGAPAAFPDGDRAGHELPVALGVARTRPPRS